MYKKEKIIKLIKENPDWLLDLDIELSNQQLIRVVFYLLGKGDFEFSFCDYVAIENKSMIKKEIKKMRDNPKKVIALPEHRDEIEKIIQNILHFKSLEFCFTEIINFQNVSYWLLGKGLYKTKDFIIDKCISYKEIEHVVNKRGNISMKEILIELCLDVDYYFNKLKTLNIEIASAIKQATVKDENRKTLKNHFRTPKDIFAYCETMVNIFQENFVDCIPFSESEYFIKWLSGLDPLTTKRYNELKEKNDIVFWSGGSEALFPYTEESVDFELKIVYLFSNFIFDEGKLDDFIELEIRSSSTFNTRLNQITEHEESLHKEYDKQAKVKFTKVRLDAINYRIKELEDTIKHRYSFERVDNTKYLERLEEAKNMRKLVYGFKE